MVTVVMVAACGGPPMYRVDRGVMEELWSLSARGVKARALPLVPGVDAKSGERVVLRPEALPIRLPSGTEPEVVVEAQGDRSHEVAGSLTLGIAALGVTVGAIFVQQGRDHPEKDPSPLAPGVVFLTIGAGCAIASAVSFATARPHLERASESERARRPVLAPRPPPSPPPAPATRTPLDDSAE